MPATSGLIETTTHGTVGAPGLASVLRATGGAMSGIDTELVLAMAIQRLSADGGFRVEQLEQELMDRFEMAPSGWQPAFDALVDRDVVAVQDGDCSVSVGGRAQLADITSRSFDDELGFASASDAYRQLNEFVSGFDLGQYSMVNAGQFDALVDALELGPEHRVLDLGCGIGRLAERVAERTGAHVTGLDFAREAIAAAEARTHDRIDRPAVRRWRLQPPVAYSRQLRRDHLDRYAVLRVRPRCHRPRPGPLAQTRRTARHSVFGTRPGPPTTSGRQDQTRHRSPQRCERWA